MVKNKLPPRSGSSLEAVEPHQQKWAIKFFLKKVKSVDFKMCMIAHLSKRTQRIKLRSFNTLCIMLEQFNWNRSLKFDKKIENITVWITL